MTAKLSDGPIYSSLLTALVISRPASDEEITPDGSSRRRPLITENKTNMTDQLSTQDSAYWNARVIIEKVRTTTTAVVYRIYTCFHPTAHAQPSNTSLISAINRLSITQTPPSSVVSPPKASVKATNSIDAIFKIFSKKLPQELINRVLQYDHRQYNDVINIVQQENEISDFVRSSAEFITVLDLSAYQGIKNIAKVLTTFKNVTSLTMPSNTTEKDLEELPKLKNILALDITKWNNITDTSLDYLTEKFTALQILHLKGCVKITSKGFAKLEKLLHLQSLNLPLSTNITNDNLAQIARLSFLKSLSLSQCWNITSKGLGYLGATHLESIELSTCEIKDSRIAQIAKIKTLKSLKLTGCKNITNNGFALLATLESLESLSLSECGDITDKSLEFLRSLPSLKSLSLQICGHVTSQAFDLLALINLESLELGHISCENNFIVQIAKIKTLKCLSLTSCGRITDEALQLLTNLQLLESLNIAECFVISDQGVEFLATLKNLKSLSLNKSEYITNTGLVKIAMLKKLEKLCISDCRNISSDGISMAKKINPNLLITFKPYKPDLPLFLENRPPYYYDMTRNFTVPYSEL